MQVRANLALETETKELGVPAGLQDRMIQAYGGLVYTQKDVLLIQGRCSKSWPSALQTTLLNVPEINAVRRHARGGCRAVD